MKSRNLDNIIETMKELGGGVSFFSSIYFYALEILNVANINEMVQLTAACIGVRWVYLKMKKEKIELDKLKEENKKK